MKRKSGTLTALVGGGCVWLASVLAPLAWPQASPQAGGGGGGKLVGIVVLGSVEEVRRNDPLTGVAGVVVQGPDFLKAREGELREALTPFLGRDLFQGEGGVQWLTNVLYTIRAFCAQKADHRVVDSFIMREGVASALQYGRIQVVVLPGQLGTIETTLVRRGIFSSAARTNASQSAGTMRKRARLASKLGVGTNQPIVTSTLSHGLRVINREPEYQEGGVLLQRGRLLGQSDVALTVTNRFPLVPFLGYDDAGNTLIGLDRVFVGGTYYDLWGHGHKVFYQFTAGAESFDYKAHAAGYEIPLRTADTLAVYGGYADFEFDLGKAAAGLETTTEDGQNTVAALRYTRAFSDALPDKAGNPRYRHAAFIGFDYKDIQATLQFSAQDSFPAAEFSVGQFSLGYQGLLRDKLGYTAFTVAGIMSPGDLFSNNDDEAFNQTVPDAEAQYFYGRLSLHRETRLVPDYLFWDIDATAQIASGALVPSEQLQFGGADSVRGFETGVLMGDHGVTVRNELGVEVPGLNRLLGFAGREGGARIHAFFDYGISFTDSSAYEEVDGTSIGSVGGGLRMRLGRFADANIDYGVQVIGEEAEKLGGSGAEQIDSRLHVYVRIRF